MCLSAMGVSCYVSRQTRIQEQNAAISDTLPVGEKPTCRAAPTSGHLSPLASYKASHQLPVSGTNRHHNKRTVQWRFENGGCLSCQLIRRTLACMSRRFPVVCIQ